MHAEQDGFTLIELSIVLVIIGLVVGGVLVGQDLVRSAGVRAQITQIEKYQTAVNTFRGKFGALPGDLNSTIAQQYGFEPRGPYEGEGDGNGVIEGNFSDSQGSNYGFVETLGETIFFWRDLTSANGVNVNLIDGNFLPTPGASVSYAQCSLHLPLTTLFPTAKINSAAYIYVWSASMINYFGLSGANGNICPWLNSIPALTVKQASAIDSKIDDGKPQQGRVFALGIANGWLGGDNGPGDVGTSTPASATSCYDDRNGTGAARAYSMATNSGAGVNCLLAIQFH